MFARNDLQDYVRRQRQRLVRNLKQAVRGGDVEAIHDVRVASRRASEAIKLMEPWLGASIARACVKKLTRMRRCFREVRDLDVLLRSLATPATAPRVTAMDLAQLEGLLTSCRQRSLERASRKIARLNGRQTVRDLDRIAKRFRREAPADDELVREQLSTRWNDRARPLLSSDRIGDTQSGLHPLRLLLKKLRYCTELWESLAGREKGELVRVCAAMQDRLGAWNDHVQAVAMLTSLVKMSDTVARQPGWTGAVLRYAADRAQAAEDLQGEILAKWPEFLEELKSQQPVFGPQPPAGQPPAQAAEA